jgi:tRNA(fMet)-specific endonuclease VapC
VYLLDTNILSNMVLDPKGPAALKAATLSNTEVAISIVVASEIRFGLARNESMRSAHVVKAMLEALTVLPLEKPADEHYGTIRADLERRGKALGPNDMLIAAHALALDATLVSDDAGFAEVAGLKLENWMRR